MYHLVAQSREFHDIGCQDCALVAFNQLWFVLYEEEAVCVSVDHNFVGQDHARRQGTHMTMNILFAFAISIAILAACCMYSSLPTVAVLSCFL